MLLGGLLHGALGYLLERKLFRSRRTQRVVRSDFLRMVFPARWKYDILRALEHFRSAGPPEPRMSEAVEKILAKRRKDGTWTLPAPHSGKRHLKLEPTRAPSRINTLRALCVLRWWL